MLDIRYIREHKEKVREAISNRGAHVALDDIFRCDEAVRLARSKVEAMRSEMNAAAYEIANAPRNAQNELKVRAKAMKGKQRHAEEELLALSQQLQSLLYQLPNIPYPEVPVGRDEHANVTLREVGEKPRFSFTAKDYVTLSNQLGILDIERAAKVSGSRFGYLKRELAIMEFALTMHIFRRLTDQRWIERIRETEQIPVANTPFTAVVPPVLIRPEIFRAMGKLDPGQEEERYFLPKDNLYLIGSAEHSLGPMFQNETLSGHDLPMRFLGFSTCFRREAGSYGKDTKGILRVHQFDKLEMFSFAHPERSREEHKFFLAVQEAIMRELSIPYRVVAVCTGDMVWTDAEQFDLEAWLPGQRDGAGEYRETHSTSNSTDFQSRRLATRFQEGKIHGLVHTINGTAAAVGRTLIAIVENYQQADGSIHVPDVLQPYTGFSKIPRRQASSSSP